MEPSRRKIQNRTKNEEAVIPLKRRVLTVNSKPPRFKSQQGTGIKCPACGQMTRVIRSMPKPDEGIHGRYRKCDGCDLRMYTEERITYRIDKK